MAGVRIESFPTGPLACNCSIIMDEESKQAIVIDPGGDFPVIQQKLEALGAEVCSIVHTHTHIDHVGATAPLQEQSGAPARIHEEDRFLYEMLAVQAAMLGMPQPPTCEIHGDLVDELVVKAGGLELGVLHTPGHTPGSVSFVVDTPGGKVLFAGDTLFRRSIGRTDLWGGDHELILRSIGERLLTLDEDTRIVTGHGPETTVGEERAQNPFVGGR